ncbi:Ubiquinone biosynthesis O-methyltransferase [uncultured archaeon]|nr:Ubiquinone biosynthesis O-methyltransferase [uncultured archaeon]
MEKLNCILCNSNDYEAIIETKDFRYHLSDDIFNVVKCRNCGLVFLNPRPEKDEMGKFYPSGYYNASPGKSEKAFCNFVNRSKINKIKELKQHGRILDIGCGNGDFLSVFSPEEWELYGIEPNPVGYNLTRRRTKINTLNETLAGCKFPDNFFDVITLWHVLEHIYEPNEELKEIGRILKDDGILVVSVPNINSLGFKLGKKHWLHLDSPRHLHHYNPETIDKIVNKNGFKIFKMTFPMFEFPLDLYHSLINSVDKKKSIKTTLMVPVMVFSLIIKPIGHIFKLSETMIVFCKKNEMEV